MKGSSFLIKIVRDLWHYRGRFLLVQTALFLGLSGFGIILSGASILNRELDRSYRAINPAAALIRTAPLTQTQREEASRFSGIREANFSRTLTARILRGDGEWGELWLVVRPDGDPFSVNRVTADSGPWPPETGSLSLERSALRMAGFKAGEKTEIRLPGGEPKTITVGGVVHDTWMAPAWMEGLIYAYVTEATAASLGADPRGDTILVTMTDTGDKAAVTETAERYARWLEERGIVVRGITVPEPGKHIHAGQMSALLFLMQVGGCLILVLAAIMIFTVMLGTIADQRKQIGILKALGSDIGQLNRLYLGLSIATALPVTLLALPGIWFGGRALAGAFSGILNFDLANRIPSAWMALVIPVAGLGVPILAALVPVLRSTLAPALSFIRGDSDSRLPLRAVALPLPVSVTLSVRNAFRNRGRAALTLSILTLAGAIFLATMLVRVSVLNLLEKTFAASPYDVGILFTNRLIDEDRKQLDQLLAPGGRHAWLLQASGSLSSIRQTGMSDESIDPFPIYGGSSLYGIRPEGNTVIVNHAFAERYGPLTEGDTLRVRIGTGEISVIVGTVTRETMVPPRLYMDEAFLSSLPGSERFQSLVQLTGKPGTDPRTVRREAESALARKGLSVEKIMDQRELEEIMTGHLSVILMTLLAITVTILIVGTLGLSSVLGLSVLERRREIGVMRCQGATAGQIGLMVASEGAVYGLTGGLLSSLLALPLGQFLGNGFAGIMLKQPLPLTPRPEAFLLWLGISVTAALCASLWPALDAASDSVSAALSYE